MGRIVCHFSCGAASAVACKVTLASNDVANVLILNAFVKEEHVDNRRFFADCERWFGHPVKPLRDTKYNASTDEVWLRKAFFASRFGAPCSAELKHVVLQAEHIEGDTVVVGYTVEERDRFENLQDTGYAQAKRVTFSAPLIERSLTHPDCLAIVSDAGIELPLMYRLGYKNANCIGCCKGGMGYWNKIRKDFPERFAEVAAIQERIGENSYTFRNRETGERFGLVQLDPNAGRYSEEPDISCSFHCALVQQEIEQP